MARTLMTITDATVVFADTQVALDTEPDRACQVTSAAINDVSSDITVPATFCEGESAVPGKPAEEFAFAWLQDFNASGGGLSMYMRTNAGSRKWFRIQPISGAEPTAEGEVYLKPGSFAGQVNNVPVSAVTMRVVGIADVANDLPTLITVPA